MVLYVCFTAYFISNLFLIFVPKTSNLKSYFNEISRENTRDTEEAFIINFGNSRRHDCTNSDKNSGNTRKYMMGLQT